MNAYLASDNVVRLSGARTIILSTGLPQYLNAAATVQFRVQTGQYQDVGGETWPVTMSYIAGSDGNFIGVLRDTVALVEEGEYRFIATVDFGVDMHGAWDIPLHVLPSM